MDNKIKSKADRKMRYFIVFIITIIVCLAYVGYRFFEDTNILQESHKEEIVESKKIETKDIKEDVKENDTKESIVDFKKKVISRGLIIKGDIHLENDDYLFALQKFSKANTQTPNNPKILSKMAETYFLMKNYKSAHKYYLRLEEKDYVEENSMVLSLMYKEKIEDYNFEKNGSGTLVSSGTILKIKKLQEEIKNTQLSEDDKFYYSNSLECLNNFHNCKLNFENYFKNDTYSGTSENLERIRLAIDNYKNLKLDELYYKNTLIIGALFENRNYPISIILSNEILKVKENYKSILKILAQSYFELNRLEQANKFLVEYAEIDSKSPDVYYMIGVISQKNQDYVKSNIFLRLALEQKYESIESIYRLQLYNYLILDQNKKISETFDKIIALKEKPDSNDLILATYYSIINNENDKAHMLTNKGLELYPKKEDFYGFKAWLKIESGELEQATELLNKAKEINSKNALIILNLGRVSKIKYEKNKNSFDKVKAKFLFKKAIELDSAEIGELAKVYLKELELEEEK